MYMVGGLQRCQLIVLPFVNCQGEPGSCPVGFSPAASMGMDVCSPTVFIEHLQCARPSPLLWGLSGELRQP